MWHVNLHFKLHSKSWMQLDIRNVYTETCPTPEYKPTRLYLWLIKSLLAFKSLACCLFWSYFLPALHFTGAGWAHGIHLPLQINEVCDSSESFSLSSPAGRKIPQVEKRWGIHLFCGQVDFRSDFCWLSKANQTSASFLFVFTDAVCVSGFSSL